MVRRAGRRRGKEKAKWSEGDGIKLLAWLDFKLNNRQEGSSFADTVCDHLKAAHTAKFTFGQVEERLRKYWNDQHRNNSKDWKDIYKRGTACLKNLRPTTGELDTDTAVRTRVSFLTDEAYAKTLSPPRRALRSVSRTTDSFLDLESVESASPSFRKRKRGLRIDRVEVEQCNSDVPLEQDFNHDRDFLATPSLQLPKVEILDDAVPSSFTQKTVVDSEDMSISSDFGPQTPTPNLSLTIDRSMENSLTSMENTGEPPEADASRDAMAREIPIPLGRFQQHHLILSLEIEPDEPAPAGDKGKESCFQLESMRRQRDDAISNCDYLDAELFQAQERSRLLENKLKSSEKLSQELAVASNQSYIKRCEDQACSIRDLERKLDDRRKFRTFSTFETAIAVPLSIKLDSTVVQTEMRCIEYRINLLLSSEDDYDFIVKPGLITDKGLESLLCRSFALKDCNGLKVQEDNWGQSPLTFHALIRALTASALCEWIFDSGFDEVSPGACKLLNIYRSLLANQDGDMALRNLDFAAHDSWIHSDLFQKHIIPRKASHLADRTIRTLQPLFIPGEHLETPSVNLLPAWLEERQTLKEIFECGLRLKATAAIKQELCEVLIVPPGTPFDERFMDTDSIVMNRVNTRSPKAPLVSVCLVPAFYAHRHDKKLVDREGFIRTDDGRRAQASSITKAKVVLKPVAQ